MIWALLHTDSFYNQQYDMCPNNNNNHNNNRNDNNWQEELINALTTKYNLRYYDS